MNNYILLPIIIAGGNGSRLWPVSQDICPKQFLKLYSNYSMLQETILRLEGLNTEQPTIICNKKHKLLVTEQLRQIGTLSQKIILEPITRNTAPAVALAALNSIVKDKNPLLLILTSDHNIKNTNAFHCAIKLAIPYAQNNKLVLFGIKPDRPETNYGYIKRGPMQDDDLIFKVKKFIEKPNIITAKKYVASGKYYWNSGLFLFNAQKYLSELEKLCPDIFKVCKEILKSSKIDNKRNFIYIDKNQYMNCPNYSIDVAIMEKTSDAIVVQLDADWYDMGSWSTVWSSNKKDKNHNVTIGNNIFIHNTSNCYINADRKIVAVIEVNNLVIINTKQALLVINKDKSQDVKKVVEHLKINV